MAESQKVFDASKHFNIPVMSGGEKRCILRFPTDAEWSERAAKQRTVRHALGRGKSQSEALNSERIDAELFARIRVDTEGTPFDEAEASAAIARLERATVLSAERDGDCYRIALRVPGARVEHVLGIPSSKDVLEYGRASVKVTDGRRQQEIRVNLEPSGELYNKLHKSTSGYQGAVPIVHKDIALVEVLTQLQQLEEEDEDPEA